MVKRVIGILIVILTSFLCIGCFNGHNNEEINNGNKDVVSYNTSDEVIENNDEEIKVDKQENIIQKDENSKNTIEKNNSEESIVDNKKLKEYFEDKKVFFINKNKEVIYNGYCEYGHKLDFNKIDKKNNLILYDGIMTDGYGEDERGSRRFTLTYTFKFDEGETPMVYERVRNSDYLTKNKDTLNSIIKNYIVMWGEPKEGKSWEQKVVYKNKEYTAKTVMKNVSENKYTLITTINNIEGFYKNTYKEERIYEKDKGLINFNNSPSYNGENEAENSSDLLFGYGLTES